MTEPITYPRINVEPDDRIRQPGASDNYVEIRSIRRTMYSDRTLAVMAEMFWADDGESEQGKLSVNLCEDEAMLPGQVLTKDLAEDEFFFNINPNHFGDRLYTTLIAAGWIEATGTITLSGYLLYPAVRLTDKAILAS